MARSIGTENRKTVKNARGVEIEEDIRVFRGVIVALMLKNLCHLRGPHQWTVGVAGHRVGQPAG